MDQDVSDTTIRKGTPILEEARAWLLNGVREWERGEEVEDEKGCSWVRPCRFC